MKGQIGKIEIEEFQWSYWLLWFHLYDLRPFSLCINCINSATLNHKKVQQSLYAGVSMVFFVVPMDVLGLLRDFLNFSDNHCTHTHNLQFLS